MQCLSVLFYCLLYSIVWVFEEKGSLPLKLSCCHSAIVFQDLQDITTLQSFWSYFLKEPAIKDFNNYSILGSSWSSSDLRTASKDTHVTQDFQFEWVLRHICLMIQGLGST